MHCLLATLLSVVGGDRQSLKSALLPGKLWVKEKAEAKVMGTLKKSLLYFIQHIIATSLNMKSIVDWIAKFAYFSNV